MGDKRSRIQRLLNYKRYIDWLVEQELLRHDHSGLGRLDHCSDSRADSNHGTVGIHPDDTVDSEQGG